MNHSSSATPPVDSRGMTLIELMIVVAIIGILAAIATVSYQKYLKKGKISKLKQYALEVQKGQEQYYSRMSQYLDPDTSGDKYVKDDKQWEKLLGFDHDLEGSITVYTTGGEVTGNSASTQNCDFCPNSKSPEVLGHWYAVRVEQDLDPTVGDDTAVYLDSEMPKPIVLNEGK